MLLKILFFMAAVTIGLSGSAKTKSHIKLVLPDNFKGDIYIVDGADRGEKWEDGVIQVPRDGVAFVKGFQKLLALPQDAFEAEYPNGEKVPNVYNSKTDRPLLLWPITQIKTLLIYFVVGSFQEKTSLDEAKMRQWPDICKELREVRRKKFGN